VDGLDQIVDQPGQDAPTRQSSCSTVASAAAGAGRPGITAQLGGCSSIVPASGLSVQVFSIFAEAEHRPSLRRESERLGPRLRSQTPCGSKGQVNPTMGSKNKNTSEAEPKVLGTLTGVIEIAPGNQSAANEAVANTTAALQGKRGAQDRHGKHGRYEFPVSFLFCTATSGFALILRAGRRLLSRKNLWTRRSVQPETEQAALGRCRRTATR
jgi:hypothetical protein